MKKRGSAHPLFFGVFMGFWCLFLVGVVCLCLLVLGVILLLDKQSVLLGLGVGG